MNKKQYIQIAHDNQTLVHDNQIEIPESIICKYKDVLDIPTSIEESTIVRFEQYKTDDCAREYILNGICSNVVIMNFASRHTPGGGYLRGARAQEEALCRSIPQLHPSLKKLHYPFEEDAILITPNVEIMRDSSNFNLLCKKDRVCVSVVSAAAPNLKFEVFNADKVKRILKNVYISVHKHLPNTDTLILGAWGCGAYRNDPIVMAKIMEEINLEYGGLYKYIIFSIPGKQNSVEFKNNITWVEL